MYTAAIAPLASAARMADGTSAMFDLGVLATAYLNLDVTAVVGATPTLEVDVETAASSTAVVWRVAGSFSPVSSALLIGQRFTSLWRYLRLRWRITGAAASFTFSIYGEGRLVYANPEDVRSLTLPEGTITNENGRPYSDSELGEFCEKATGDFDDHIGARAVLPLAAWGRSTRDHCAELAAFYGWRKRGGGPADPGGARVVAMKDDVMSWLTQVHRGEIVPFGIVDQTASIEEGGAYIVTAPRRGWGVR